MVDVCTKHYSMNIRTAFCPKVQVCSNVVRESEIPINLSEWDNMPMILSTASLLKSEKLQPAYPISVFIEDFKFEQMLVLLALSMAATIVSKF